MNYSSLQAQSSGQIEILHEETQSAVRELQMIETHRDFFNSIACDNYGWSCVLCHVLIIYYYVFL